MPSRRPDSELAIVELARLFAESRRHVWACLSGHLEPSGRTLLGFRLLRRLAEGGPATQRELSDWTGQHPAGISRLLEEMERKRLVARSREAGDRRRVAVRLLPAGLREFEATRPLVRQGLMEGFANLSSAEQAQLASLLAKVVAGGGAKLPLNRARAATRTRQPARSAAPPARAAGRGR